MSTSCLITSPVHARKAKIHKIFLYIDGVEITFDIPWTVDLDPISFNSWRRELFSVLASGTCILISVIKTKLLTYNFTYFRFCHYTKHLCWSKCELYRNCVCCLMVFNATLNNMFATNRFIIMLLYLKIIFDILIYKSMYPYIYLIIFILFIYS